LQRSIIVNEPLKCFTGSGTESGIASLA
jgi:hypothetical protein